MGEQALPSIRIEAPQGNYDYQNKYFTDDTKYICPAACRAEIEDVDPRRDAACASACWAAAAGGAPT